MTAPRGTAGPLARALMAVVLVPVGVVAAGLLLVVIGLGLGVILAFLLVELYGLMLLFELLLGPLI